MKTKSFVALLLLPLFAFTCEDKVEGGHEHIIFINNSEDIIYLTQKPQMKILPTDTLYECNNYETELHPKDSFLCEPLNSYWETDFKVRDFVMFFVFSKSTFDNPCEEVRKYQLKRYQLTKEDLDRMNWVITYP
jgi:hypothetical protein